MRRKTPVWNIFAVVLGFLFIVGNGHEVLAADITVIDNNAPIENGVTVPLIDPGVNVKIILGRGQSLSSIAQMYTGDADNWTMIAKASGLKTSDSAQQKLSVRTVISIPQALLKPEFLPTHPTKSSEFYEKKITDAVRGNDIDRKWYNDILVSLQRELSNAEQQIFYWVIISGALALTLILMVSAAVGARRQHERKWKYWEGEYLKSENQYLGLLEVMPGSSMDFTTRENKIVTATITKTELINGHPQVTEVQCLAPMAMSVDNTTKCGALVKPGNLLSHHFQQHPVGSQV